MVTKGAGKMSFGELRGLKKGASPYAPIPSASGFGEGFGYLNTFKQGIWSTKVEGT